MLGTSMHRINVSVLNNQLIKGSVLNVHIKRLISLPTMPCAKNGKY